jgi:hypothetical protein
MDLGLELVSYPSPMSTGPRSSMSRTSASGLTDATPGSLRGMHLVTADIRSARDALVARGVDVSEYFHFEAGERVPGLGPDHGRCTSFASFSDPDGNTWLLQEA